VAYRALPAIRRHSDARDACYGSVIGGFRAELDTGAPLALPTRKTQALLAYLALESAPVSRSRLCDLLWDVPNDPRGELRWYLSKLRNLLDDENRSRVVTSGRDLIALGHRPGPLFREILDRAFDAQLEGEISTPEAAHAWVQARYPATGPGPTA